MAVNIEIKAHLRDRPGVEARAAALADGQGLVINQEDTFFVCPKGRLKVRVEGKNPAQLIYYERADKKGPKPSHYYITRIKDPENLILSLGKALGILGRVVKERTLYIYGATRIHLDRVEGLGEFMELEVVLNGGTSQPKGRTMAESIMRKLGIEKEDLVRDAYIDLLKSC